MYPRAQIPDSYGAGGDMNVLGFILCAVQVAAMHLLHHAVEALTLHTSLIWAQRGQDNP